MQRQPSVILKVIILLSLLFVIPLGSCEKPPVIKISNVPTLPLFDQSSNTAVSINSGNLYYNGFLSSDGKSVYFQSDDGKSLVKSDYNGENAMIISKRFPSFINVVDDTVYYIEGLNSGKVYKVGSDGKGETLVIDSNVRSLIVTTKYIIFIDTKDDLAYYSLHDGSKKTLLYKKVFAQLVLSKELLFLVPSGYTDGLYKTDISSNFIKPVEYVKITNNPIDLNSLNYEKNKFYFIDLTNNSQIASSENLRVRGFVKKSLSNPFIVSGDFAYYIDTADESRLYRVHLYKSDIEKIVVNDRVNEFVVCGNSVYYRRKNNLEVYRTSIDGGISFKIT